MFTWTLNGHYVYVVFWYASYHQEIISKIDKHEILKYNQFCQESAKCCIFLICPYCVIMFKNKLICSIWTLQPLIKENYIMLSLCVQCANKYEL